ncbi:hypothetical protein BaRGS_00033638 [Batillaria attramentaria]|uniref:Uncharacterized protein n=1 Tax=Batillaria attramentaria TaxID=370345 RepID=A0ABD0JJU3_9CAEN
MATELGSTVADDMAGGAQPKAAILIIVGEPFSEDDKTSILAEIAKVQVMGTASSCCLFCVKIDHWKATVVADIFLKKHTELDLHNNEPLLSQFRINESCAPPPLLSPGLPPKDEGDGGVISVYFQDKDNWRSIILAQEPSCVNEAPTPATGVNVGITWRCRFECFEE